MLSTKCKQKWHRNALIWHFLFWFQWKHLSRLPKLWNFHLVNSKCFQIKFITNKFLFTGRCHFQLSNILITKRFWLAGDDDYLRGATSINHQVALRANFKMYSRSAKGGEKGDPNRNPWLAKMAFKLLNWLQNFRFSNSLTSIFWQESRTKVSKLYKCFKNDNFEICVPERSNHYRLLLYIADWTKYLFIQWSINSVLLSNVHVMYSNSKQWKILACFNIFSIWAGSWKIGTSFTPRKK